MVQYLPDFKIIQGETFQVPIGGGKTVDFRFKNIIVEYHHPRLKPSKRHLGDFPSKQSYLKFKKELEGIRNAEKREEFVEEVKEELIEHYYDKRRHALNDHPTHRNAELVVVSSPQEVFEKIISRFSRTSEMSPEEIENLADSILEMIHESAHHQDEMTEQAK
jgi:hypothetical protein